MFLGRITTLPGPYALSAKSDARQHAEAQAILAEMAKAKIDIKPRWEEIEAKLAAIADHLPPMSAVFSIGRNKSGRITIQGENPTAGPKSNDASNKVGAVAGAKFIEYRGEKLGPVLLKSTPIYSWISN